MERVRFRSLGVSENRAGGDVLRWDDGRALNHGSKDAFGQLPNKISALGGEGSELEECVNQFLGKVEGGGGYSQTGHGRALFRRVADLSQEGDFYFSLNRA